MSPLKKSLLVVVSLAATISGASAIDVGCVSLMQSLPLGQIISVTGFGECSPAPELSGTPSDSKLELHPAKILRKLTSAIRDAR
jgi:hypothetical protein